MIRLALVMRDHAHALEFDLMTRTGRTLAEYEAQGADGRIALAAFLRYAPPDSAVYRETHPKDELAAWSTTMKTNAILADIFDAYVASHVKKGRRPKPYPRPSKDGPRVLGKGAIPIRDFEEWWNSGE